MFLFSILSGVLFRLLDLFLLFRLLVFRLFLGGLFLVGYGFLLIGDGFLLIGGGFLLLLGGGGSDDGCDDGLLSLAFLVVFDGLLGGLTGLPEPNFVAAVEYPHGGIVSIAVIALVVGLGHLFLEHFLQADGLLLPGSVGDKVAAHASVQTQKKNM